ncbi:MAG TPA: hypothetical protein VIJ26_15785 [Thermoanaerobaculia bacterium]
MKRIFKLTALTALLAATPWLGPVRAVTLPPLTYCGDPCYTEGASKGCLFYRNGVLARDTCTCTGGTWDCLHGGA